MRTWSGVRLLGLVGLFACGAHAPNSLAQPIAPAFKMIEMGTFGGRWSFPWGINRHEQATGHAEFSTPPYNVPFHAFSYNFSPATLSGTLQDLNAGGVGAANWSCESFDINDAADMVGYCDFDPSFDSYVSIRYHNGVMTQIPTPAPATASEARGINSFGDIVGNWTTTSPWVTDADRA